MARVAHDTSPKRDKARKRHKANERPARGYHKFRNGLLNVKPKGGEKAITEVNRSSPLLKLPAEIRNAIWEFALGGSVLRPVLHWPHKGYGVLRASPAEPNGVPLLRVCRQIYAEAASMPLSLSTLSCDWSGTTLSKMRRLLKPHQRKYITSVQIEFRSPRCFNWGGVEVASTGLNEVLKLFPALRRYRLCVFRSEQQTYPTPIPLDEEVMEQAREHIKTATAGTDVDAQIKYMEQTWWRFERVWSHPGTPVNNDAPAAQSTD